MIDPKTATLSEFQDLVGTSFDISEGDSVMTLTLSEAAAMGSGAREGGAFSLVFEGPADLMLEQGVFRLKQDGQCIDLFLVPIGPFGKGMGFEAVFT